MISTLCIIRIQHNSEMYFKIQLIYVYKNAITSMGVSLTDNHHIRVIVMIHRSTSRYQRIPYPAKGIGPELPNGSTSLL